MRRKKAGKSPGQPTSSTKKTVRRNEDAWLEVLESMGINDDHWWCLVSMMVETIVQHGQIVSLLSEAAEEGSRRAIYALSRQKTMSLVRILSREDPAECEALQTVCHYARKLLDADEPLSSWLIARLIKYFIYRAKVENVAAARKQMEMHSAEAVDDVFGKINTRLRRRGENSVESAGLDDAPLIGPNLYVILLGFHEADLPVELAKAGVPLTCVLRIRRPAEKFEEVIQVPRDPVASQRFSQFPLTHEASKLDLYKFWTTIERDLRDVKKIPDYGDIAFLTFCPPELPGVIESSEYETVKKDIYDRVSYIVYDLYDLRRQYVKYTRSTKLQKLDCEDKEPDTSIYQELIDSVPGECASVAVVLFALLMQVENNVSELGSDSSSSAEGSSKLTEGIQQSESEVSFPREKLTALDEKYRVVEGGVHSDPDRSRQQSGIKLILHGDKLGVDLHEIYLGAGVRRILDDTPRIWLADAILSVFVEPRITELWETRGGHMYHVNGNAAKTLIDRENAVHYFHVSLFDKMIDRPPLNANDRSSIKSPEEMAGQRDLIEAASRSRSLESSKITWRSPTTLPWRRVKSDGVASYPRVNPSNNSSDSSSPGYSRDAVFNKELHENSLLEDYEYLELLAPRVFLQTVQQCYQQFDDLQVKYCQPTDTMLLYFHWKPREDRKVSGLRTAVTFREFCEQVVIEEEEWIRKEAEEHRAEVAASSAGLPEGEKVREERVAELRDECFILPWSLKARTLRRSRVSDKQGVTRDKKEETVANERDRKDKESSKERKLRSRRAEEKKSESMADPIDTYFLPPRKILSARYAGENEPWEFLAYELDGFRPRLVSRVKTFLSCDGTRVRLKIDEWLHRCTKDVHIEISSRIGCRLHLPLQLPRSPSDELSFHFVSDNGIILAFSRASKGSVNSDAAGTGRNSDWREFEFDFRASWPSGLIVELLAGDSPVNPFYVRQFYVNAARPACGEVARETSRKFLRNGTLLKYHEDGSVHVYRPNGTIVKRAGFDTTSSVPESSTKQSAVWQVLDHEGRRYDVSGDRVVREYDRTFLSVSSAYDADEKCIRRADGTEMLFRSNGELVVYFNDGTRITTGYVIEEEAVSCEWSLADYVRFFERINEQEEDGIVERYENVGLSSDKSSAEVSSSLGLLDETEIGRILNVEPFVSVLLTCRFQQENYASVEYDPSAVTALLSMPGELCVSLSAKGLSEISIGKEISLSVRKEDVTFECSSTRSVYDLDGSSGLIFRTNDASGNVFEVDNDGTRSYRSSSEREAPNENSPKDEEMEFHGRADRATATFRIFALKRNLSAYEYLPRAVAEEVEGAARDDHGTSIIRHTKSVEEDRDHRALVTFTPVASRFPPKLWTHSTPRKQLPSTYSVPYDWLFPFGRKGLGTRANTHDVPLNKRVEKSLPKLLKVRVLQRFKAEDIVPDETASLPEDFENLAIGVKKIIDAETYVRGLDGKFKVKVPGVSRKLVDASSKDETESQDVECYRKCWKERRIMPYFRNIAGSCHLWVKSCVDSVDASQTFPERQVCASPDENNHLESHSRIYTTFAELFSHG